MKKFIVLCLCMLLVLTGCQLESNVDSNTPGESTSTTTSTSAATTTSKITTTTKKTEYGIGETWVVDDQWEFTIDSVEKHEMCNRFSDLNDLPQCIIITYSYKNLGYTNSIQDLYISSSSFDVYDETGEAAETYPCTHTKSPKVCSVGTKCTGAQQAYALSNESSEITLIVEEYTSNNTGKQKATFKLKIG